MRRRWRRPTWASPWAQPAPTSRWKPRTWQLLADDWRLVPEVFHIAQRTMGVVKFNLGFTVVYNVVGLTLAAVGLLPPMLAAAAQSIPDLAILGNSARLMRGGVESNGEEK